MLSVPGRPVCLIGGIIADRHIDEPVRKKIIEILVEIVLPAGDSHSSGCCLFNDGNGKLQ